MSKVRIAAMGFVTVAVALSAAHFMQAGGNSVPAAELNMPEVAPVQTNALPNSADLEGDLAISSVTLTSALPTDPDAMTAPVAERPVMAPTKTALIDDPLPEMPQEESVPALDCNYNLTAKPEAAAMVRLTLDASCMDNERFTLHQNGMMFTGVTDENGTSEMLVPALSAKPVFIVAFLNGEGAVANADVPSMEYYDRAVVQWIGQSGLQLHARENGADYGEEGHVWAGAARDTAYAALGQGGFLTRLGDARAAEPLLAEVYTFPSGMLQDAAQVALSVEAEVTAENCGKDVEAQTLQVSALGEMRTQDLVLAIPECDARGDFLVLKNLLNDLSIAAN